MIIIKAFIIKYSFNSILDTVIIQSSQISLSNLTRMQLMDLMGAVQTTESHEAALKVLDFKSEAILDLNERYLWSLSLSSHPSSHIIKGKKQS